MVLVTGFNRYEAAELTDCTYDRLVYLDKIDLVKPAGKYGRTVLYSLDQLVQLVAIETYRVRFASELDEILDALKFHQLVEGNRNKEMVYFKVIDNDIRFYIDFVDETLSAKDFLAKLLSKIEFDEDVDPEDYFVEINVLKSVNYFIKKLLDNSNYSERLSQEEFIERAGLQDFKY